MKQLIKKLLRGSIKITEDIGVRLGVGATRLLPTRTWLRIREKAQIVRELDYSRVPTHMVVDSWIEKDVRIHSCKKEPGTVEWIESWFKPGDVFYDVGANVGAYSLVAFQFLSSRTRIYAFEPGFMTFPQLCRNIYLNSAGKAIIPLQIALSDQTALTAFHYQNLVSGGALHALGAPLDQGMKRFQPIFTLPTLSYRLDDFVQQFDLPVPNHIKIDVDGTEYQILKGSEQILTHPELKSILLEVNEEHEGAVEVAQLLKANGFMLHSRRNENNLYCRKDLQP